MILTVLLLSSVASGCATVTSEYCLIAEPIVYTDEDVEVISDELVRSVLTHNEKYDTLCK